MNTEPTFKSYSIDLQNVHILPDPDTKYIFIFLQTWR